MSTFYYNVVQRIRYIFTYFISKKEAYNIGFDCAINDDKKCIFDPLGDNIIHWKSGFRDAKNAIDGQWLNRVSILLLFGYRIDNYREYRDGFPEKEEDNVW